MGNAREGKVVHLFKTLIASDRWSSDFINVVFMLTSSCQVGFILENANGQYRSKKGVIPNIKIKRN